MKYHGPTPGFVLDPPLWGRLDKKKMLDIETLTITCHVDFESNPPSLVQNPLESENCRSLNLLKNSPFRIDTPYIIHVKS